MFLKTRKEAHLEWFDLQYEKLPFYCLSCGIMGHSELECDKPVIRNGVGKLPYDIKLRAPEVKKKKSQSFQEATAASYGSGSSSSSRRSKERLRDDDLYSGNTDHEKGLEEDEEVISPIKNDPPKETGGGALRRRHMQVDNFFRIRKHEPRLRCKRGKQKALGAVHHP